MARIFRENLTIDRTRVRLAVRVHRAKLHKARARVLLLELPTSSTSSHITNISRVTVVATTRIRTTTIISATTTTLR